MRLAPLLFYACARATLHAPPGPTGAFEAEPVHAAWARRVDAGVVPGCPAEDDGRMTHCLWRRAVWAHHVWATGLTDTLIVSGNAVQSPYTESAALKAALVALGVPAERIIEEPLALHTDENIAYALRIAEQSGFQSLAIVTDAVQTTGTCDMVRNWTHRAIDCLRVPMDYALVHTRMDRDFPALALVPVTDWEPLKEREKKIATRLGIRPRPSSFVVYVRGTILGIFGLSKPPPLLPMAPEGQ